MDETLSLLFSTHFQAVMKNIAIWNTTYKKVDFLKENKLFLTSLMSENLEQASKRLSNNVVLSPEQQQEAIIIDKFILDLVLNRVRVQDYYDNLEKSFQVPFFLSQDPKTYSAYSLLLFRRTVLESESYFEEYTREKPLIGIFSPMFKCICSFAKEYDLESKRASMLNHIPFLNFLKNFFNSLGVEVKENEYWRDENGNILVDQLLTISYERFNMCGIVSNDLSVESEDEWRKCILTSHIMQRKQSNFILGSMFSLCFIIHSSKITFFCSHQPYSLDYFLFNKIQTWDFCNADHLIEIVGCLFTFITLSWINLNTNPFGYGDFKFRTAINAIELYEQSLKRKEEDKQGVWTIKLKKHKSKRTEKVKFTESVIDQLLKFTINK